MLRPHHFPCRTLQRLVAVSILGESVREEPSSPVELQVLGIMQNLVVILHELGPKEKFKEVRDAYQQAISAKPTATLAAARLNKLAGRRGQSSG